MCDPRQVFIYIVWLTCIDGKGQPGQRRPFVKVIFATRTASLCGTAGLRPRASDSAFWGWVAAIAPQTVSLRKLKTPGLLIRYVSSWPDQEQTVRGGCHRHQPCPRNLPAVQPGLNQASTRPQPGLHQASHQASQALKQGHSTQAQAQAHAPHQGVHKPNHSQTSLVKLLVP